MRAGPWARSASKAKPGGGRVGGGGRGLPLRANDRAGRDPARGGKRGERCLHESLSVGRIEENQRAGRRRARRAAGVGREHGAALRFAAGGDVGAQGGQGGAVVLQERGVAGAARKRFQSHRAGAGEGVQHPRAVHGRAASPGRVPQNVEQGLAHAVRRRAGFGAGRRDEPAAAVPAGDDARHGGGETLQRAGRQAGDQQRQHPPRRRFDRRWIVRGGDVRGVVETQGRLQHRLGGRLRVAQPERAFAAPSSRMRRTCSQRCRTCLSTTARCSSARAW
jgi:hypothetical protein